MYKIIFLYFTFIFTKFEIKVFYYNNRSLKKISPFTIDLEKGLDDPNMHKLYECIDDLIINTITSYYQSDFNLSSTNDKMLFNPFKKWRYSNDMILIKDLFDYPENYNKNTLCYLNPLIYFTVENYLIDESSIYILKMFFIIAKLKKDNYRGIKLFNCYLKYLEMEVMFPKEPNEKKKLNQEISKYKKYLRLFKGVAKKKLENICDITKEVILSHIKFKGMCDDVISDFEMLKSNDIFLCLIEISEMLKICPFDESYKKIMSVEEYNFLRQLN